MRLRRIAALLGAIVLLIVKFAIDLIGKSVELSSPWGMSAVRDVIVICLFLLIIYLLYPILERRARSALNTLGFLLIATFSLVTLSSLGLWLSTTSFDTKNFSLLPLDYPTIFLSSFFGVLFGVFALIVLYLLRSLILLHRRKGTERNLWIMRGLFAAAALSTISAKPLNVGTISNILFGLGVTLALVSSFRLPWIVYLTKREKLLTLVYAFFLCGGFITLDIFIALGPMKKTLLYYSVPLREFGLLVSLFGSIYAGMTFVSTLFHLPTADAFDRKRSEVTSLHNLSKLITQAFDFKELVETVLSMTLDVCEAKSCWIELVEERDGGEGDEHPLQGVRVVGMKNITQEEIDILMPPGEQSLRTHVAGVRQAVVIDSLQRDARINTFARKAKRTGSMAVAPLVSHDGLIGILYAAKDSDYGFLQDDVDVITAFADQATVAIENSRLISKSLERERLMREMMLAQEMQKKLLPQHIPAHDAYEIDATSTPAAEVGGDYYDVMQLTPTTIGIIVGDVSGKGVSAAFYMAEMKGIFQAIGGMYTSPKDFLVRANDALNGSIDKHSFVSLIYAVLDLSTGALTTARAGHCPMLHVSKGEAAYRRPGGIGMGLTDRETFWGAIEEETISLREGDLCVLYTDGLTEARRGDEEFGYERLLDAAAAGDGASAGAVKDAILASVAVFTEGQASHDDLTLLVLRWRGLNATKQTLIRI